MTDEWLEMYNTERPHRSLGGVPPRTYLPRTHAGYRNETKDQFSGEIAQAKECQHQRNRIAVSKEHESAHEAEEHSPK